MCSVCLEPLFAHHLAVMLNSEGVGPPLQEWRACRHFIHHRCAVRLCNERGRAQLCPLCRAPFTRLQRVPRIWVGFGWDILG